MMMSVLIRCRETGAYLDGGAWTQKPSLAHDFKNSIAALDTVRALHLQKVELEFRFEDPRYNYAIRVADP
jgi:hypothetical protein